MKKLENYILGNWIAGEGEGTPLYNSVNGEIVAMATTKGLDFEKILKYGKKDRRCPSTKNDFPTTWKHAQKTRPLFNQKKRAVL